MLEVTLRSVARHDAERLFTWRSADEIDRWMFSEPPASFDAHTEWFEGLLKRDDRWQWIIEVGRNPVGLLTLAASHEPGVLDLGVYVAQRSEKGVGEVALRRALDLARSLGLEGRVRADVFADNVRAIDLYRRIGFVESSTALSNRVKRGVSRSVLRFEISVVDSVSPIVGREG